MDLQFVSPEYVSYLAMYAGALVLLPQVLLLFSNATFVIMKKNIGEIPVACNIHHPLRHILSHVQDC